MIHNKLKRRGMGDIIMDGFIMLNLLFLVFITLYPFLNIAAISLNDASDTIKGGVHIWPRVFTTYNYRTIFSNHLLLNATKISVYRTVLGTVLSVFLTTMLAYTLTRKHFVLRNFIMVCAIITMYIDGGLIPNFMLIRNLGLVNNFWVYILPGLIHPFNLLVIRTYINGLPESFIESAKIDGASEYRILAQIVMPLCLPVLATIALFVAVGQWNAWFDTFLYASSKPELSTLQYELMKLLQSANTLSSSAERAFAQAAGNGATQTITPTAIRAAMTMVTSIPIIIVYPFLQKYFIKGLTLGGVKG